MFIYGILVAFVNFKIKNTGLSLKSSWIGFTGILLFYSVFNDKFDNENLDIWAIFLLFFIIVRGNSILGVLNWKSSQILGQLSYSVYLIHGLVIYTLNTFIIPKSYVLSLSKTNYMFMGIVYCSAIIFVSFLTHICIELPGNKLITHIRNIMPKMDAELKNVYTKSISMINK